MLYSIRNLKKVHGSTTILDLNHLEVEAGKVYTLIGPNGAGKTTLLNILAFLDLPTSGELVFQGEAVQYHPRILRRLRQKVVQVDQYPILFTGTVGKNVEYGLKVRKVGRWQRQDMVKRVLAQVGMSRFIHADARTLSGGETKRVALARALAVEPEVLICDEPTANVDAENQKIILDILKNCNNEKKVSLLFATHSLSDATRLADHTIILQNGRLVQNRRTNVFAVAQRGTEGAGRIWRIGGCLDYPLSKTGPLTNGASHVHLDPGKISCHPLDATPGGDSPSWRGTTRKIEHYGDGIRLNVDCGIELQIMLSPEAYASNRFYVGQEVWVSFELTPEMFFTG